MLSEFRGEVYQGDVGVHVESLSHIPKFEVWIPSVMHHQDREVVRHLPRPVSKRQALSPLSNVNVKVRHTSRSPAKGFDGKPYCEPTAQDKENLSPNPALVECQTPRTPRSASKVLPKEHLRPSLCSQLKLIGVDVDPDSVKLGQGTFGVVVLGLWKGSKVAVKVLGNKDRMRCKYRRRSTLESEKNVMKLTHPNIIKVVAFFDAPNEVDNSIIVMEFAGKQSIQSLLDEKSTLLTKKFIQRALVQISSALVHCHSKDIIHLDVKPANILVGSDENCKLADFGCSKRADMDFTEQCSKRRRALLLGTPGYQAPEYLQNCPPSTKCDVFSYGITMWQMLAKERAPFPGIHMHTIMFMVVSQSYRPCELSASSVSQAFKDLYRICWAQRPENRPPMTRVTEILAICGAEMNDEPKTEPLARVKMQRLR